MSATISTLPVWKRDSTAAEWLQELAGLAMEFPERWQGIVVVCRELDEEGVVTRTSHYSHGLPTNSEVIGTLEVGKLLVFDTLRGRE